MSLRLSPTSSPAKGSCPLSRPLRATRVTALPSDAKAVAISAATTPPPMTTIEVGTTSTLVASRLVHGCDSARPGMSGRSAAVPVETTTACAASCSVTDPSGAVTVTRRGPEMRPWPRARSMPMPSSQLTCPWSSQELVKESRRFRTAATSSSPVTASFDPATARAARRALPERRSALLGMQAQ